MSHFFRSTDRSPIMTLTIRDIALRFFAALALLAVLGLLPRHGIPAAATSPGLNGKIVFGSDRDGNVEIYIMNANGSGQTRLTSNPAVDAQAAWSPDGSKIAFASERDGN